MKHVKWLFIGLASLFAAAFVLWGLLWIQFLTCFPPEHPYVASASPDGKKTARFSVKYEGITRWLPSDIEPHYYVTIVDTAYGRILLRKSEYHGDLNGSFAELAKKHAPWAVTQLDSAKQ